MKLTMSTTQQPEKLTETNSISEPREEIIKTAVKFLKNPHVTNSPLSKSQQFLKSKGLTDQEIQIACERAGAYNNYNEQFQQTTPNLPPALHTGYAPVQQSMFMKVRDILQSITVFSGFIYAVYLFYKKCIHSWLFGEKKKKSLEETITDLNKSVTESINDIRDNLTEVRTQVDQLKHYGDGTQSTHVQLQDLKNEISSVKGLLLSRKQFPGVGSGTLVPPSIPAWQLSSEPHDQDGEGDGKAEELMEIGSGSGSSETEVVTKNSDSSLEIM